MDSALLAGLVGGVVGVLVGIGIWSAVLGSRGRSLRSITERAWMEADNIRTVAEREAAAQREEQIVAGREEALAIKEEAAHEADRRRAEVERTEQRIAEREHQISEREQRLREEDRQLVSARERLATRERELGAASSEVARLERLVRERLEQVAGISAAEAARQVRQEVEDAARAAAQAQAREIRENARVEADREARRIISMATQRLAAEHTAETTVSAVPLPSDDMKGRIIGREGRNIRAFELATGVDVIIDDTPDSVVISCFDPVRRETARRALAALVADGRIHPGRIEEVVDRARSELESELNEHGERAAFDVGVHGLHPELLKLIGRMRYRTSYGQNLYEHSKEAAWLAGMMAEELRLDATLARRGALLHDIGKVLTHEHEGTHVQLGVDVCRRFGESAAVLNAIEAHHDDVPHESAESVLVQAADAISGSRPGARREAFESYVKRLARLEEIASSYPGVERTNVIQAGREIRVIVKPEQIDDPGALELSEAIARRIEAELQYPGQIRVTVIRETRATGIAR